MSHFDVRETVMHAMKETESFLYHAYEKSLSTESGRGFATRYASRLNMLLHKLNLHVTTWEKMNSMEKWQREPMGQWSCAGTIRFALEKPEMFGEVHEMLSDQESRQCLEWVLSFRVAYALIGQQADRVFPPRYSWEEYYSAVAKLTDERFFESLGIRSTFTDLGLQRLDSASQYPVAFASSFAFEQYALASRVEVEQDDIILDIGAFIGDSALWFIQKGADTVYAFEPDPANFTFLQRMSERLHLGSKLVPVNLAVGSVCSRMKFAATGGEASAIADEGMEINVTSVDHFVEEQRLQKVDFIKMDIEGFELEALKGAVKTIEKFKPKLAICVYHRPEDLVEIPLFLKELLPDAKFYLSHKSHTWADTVLFVNPR